MTGKNEKARTDRAVAQVAMARVHPDTWLGIEAIGLLTGWAKPTIYRKGQEGRFPRPVAPGRWRGGDVLQHLAQKAGGSSA
ncbi:hypothetical protein JQ608_38455 [Bradyrhizobium liaoningense]|uniref:helix-turn-helix transcriptional regulator n=1 Tax=Bradyrhizobium liaoningense TaxID=43992 RepID=UPI001BA613E3|nr:hypothetical protein [Bradyrhizobium liaoningense]MBR0882907.1 hypothetical protein [Bradyrhizobium liaoningense]